LKPVSELSQANHWQSRPFISSDDSTLFFYDSRVPENSVTIGRGGGDLGMIVRPSSNAPWSSAINLGNAINTPTGTEDTPAITADGQTFYFSRFDAFAPDDPTGYNSGDIWQSSVLRFDAVGLSGAGGNYSQDFTSLGTEDSAGSPLPIGWTFTANDVVFNNATTDNFPTRSRSYAGVFNGGADGNADRALVTDESVNEAGELGLRTHIETSDLQAVRLSFDLEAWQVYRTLGAGKGAAAFHVVLEADTGSGFAQVADLGTVTTGRRGPGRAGLEHRRSNPSRGFGWAHAFD
jgi:hypothetical protein